MEILQYLSRKPRHTNREFNSKFCDCGLTWSPGVLTNNTALLLYRCKKKKKKKTCMALLVPRPHSDKENRLVMNFLSYCNIKAEELKGNRARWINSDGKLSGAWEPG